MRALVRHSKPLKHLLSKWILEDYLVLWIFLSNIYKNLMQIAIQKIFCLAPFMSETQVSSFQSSWTFAYLLKKCTGTISVSLCSVHWSLTMTLMLAWVDEEKEKTVLLTPWCLIEPCLHWGVWSAATDCGHWLNLFTHPSGGTVHRSQPSG